MRVLRFRIRTMMILVALMALFYRAGPWHDLSGARMAWWEWVLCHGLLLGATLVVHFTINGGVRLDAPGGLSVVS